MRIRDIILVGLVILWLIIVLWFLLKKKKGTCFGCSGAQCGSCRISKKKRK